MAKKTPKARTTKPAAKPLARRPVRLPIVLSVKRTSDAKQVQAAVDKLVDAGLLRPLTFEQAHAFFTKAQDWPGPGYVVLVK
jgi:hypothetical protein